MCGLPRFWRRRKYLNAFPATPVNTGIEGREVEQLRHQLRQTLKSCSISYVSKPPP